MSFHLVNKVFLHSDMLTLVILKQIVCSWLFTTVKLLEGNDAASESRCMQLLKWKSVVKLLFPTNYIYIKKIS
jgi:hypothetical protein